MVYSCSLFVVRCSLFVVRCSWLIAHCSLIAHCLFEMLLQKRKKEELTKKKFANPTTQRNLISPQEPYQEPY